jgi:hypothetical protein
VTDDTYGYYKADPSYWSKHFPGIFDPVATPGKPARASKPVKATRKARKKPALPKAAER